MVAPGRRWQAVQGGGGTAAVNHSLLHEVHEVHGPGVRRMLRRLLGPGDEAHDVYQECLCQLADRADRPAIQHAGAYAYQTAANLAIERIRRRRRRAGHWEQIVHTSCVTRQAAIEDPHPPVDESPHNRVADLHVAVSALPQHLRNVVVLRDLLQMPYRRVGQMLGIQPTTARVYRRQAIVRLGGLLGANEAN